MAPSSDKALPEFSFRSRADHWAFLKTQSSSGLPIPVLIVGGGIVGAGILRELTLRDTPAVLVEKNDFASGTSGASSKLIHAGIRYLEQVWTRLKLFQFKPAWENFRFVWAASNERWRLGRMAPDLIRPKAIRLVLGKGDPRSVASVAAGVWAYYFLQILQGQFFPPPHCAWFRFGLARLAPDLDSSCLKAVFTFWDSETDDARLVIETLQSAHDSGARALNYVELSRWEQTDAGVRVDLRDTESGETVSVLTEVLINAAGAFVDEIRAREVSKGEPSSPLVDRVAGSHLDVFPSISRESYYVTAGDGRLVFVLARNEDGLLYSRIGTTERPLSQGETSERPLPTKAETDYLRDLVKTFFPNANINDATVLRADAGIRPLRAQSAASAFQKSREHEILCDGRAYHIIGVKLTDFRRVAEEVVTLIDWPAHGVSRPKKNGPSFLIPLRPAPIEKLYTEETITAVAQRTMVIHWDDFLLRRRGLAPIKAARENEPVVESWFKELGVALHWDAARRAEEKKRGQRALENLRCPL